MEDEREFEDVRLGSHVPDPITFDPNAACLREQFVLECHVGPPLRRPKDSCLAGLWDDKLQDLRLEQPELHKISKECLQRNFNSLKTLHDPDHCGFNKLILTASLRKVEGLDQSEVPVIEVQYFHIGTGKHDGPIKTETTHLSNIESNKLREIVGRVFQNTKSLKIIWEHLNCRSWANQEEAEPQYGNMIQETSPVINKIQTDPNEFMITLEKGDETFSSRSKDLAKHIRLTCFNLLYRDQWISIQSSRPPTPEGLLIQIILEKEMSTLIEEMHDPMTIQPIPPNLPAAVHELAITLRKEFLGENYSSVFAVKIFESLTLEQKQTISITECSRAKLLTMYFSNKGLDKVAEVFKDYFEPCEPLTSLATDLEHLLYQSQRYDQINMPLRELWARFKHQGDKPQKLFSLGNTLVEVKDSCFLDFTYFDQNPNGNRSSCFDTKITSLHDSCVYCDDNFIYFVKATTVCRVDRQRLKHPSLCGKNVHLSSLPRQQSSTVVSDSVISSVYRPDYSSRNSERDTLNKLWTTTMWYLRIEHVNFDSPEPKGYIDFPLPEPKNPFSTKTVLKSFDNNSSFATAFFFSATNRLHLGVWKPNTDKFTLRMNTVASNMFQDYLPALRKPADQIHVTCDFWKKDGRYFFVLGFDNLFLSVYCMTGHTFQRVCNDTENPKYFYRLKDGYSLMPHAIDPNRLSLFSYKPIGRGVTTPNKLKVNRILLDL